MDHKVTALVSTLFILFSQTSVLSQSSFAHTTLASTPTAQESQPNSSSADAPVKRRSAGTRFIDIQPSDLEDNNHNLYYPDAWVESQDSNISTGFEQYKQGNLAAALENFNTAETKLSVVLGNDSSNTSNLPTVETQPTANIPDRDSPKSTPQANPQDVEEYAAIANATGLIYRDLEEWEQSEAYFNKALSAFATIDNDLGRSIALSNLGTNYRQLKQPQEALNYYQLALEASENSDRHNQKYILNQTALAYYESGDKQKSLNYFQQLLAVAKEENNALDKAIAFNNIGEVYRSLGRKLTARRNYKLALENLSDSNSQLTTIVEENIASDSSEKESLALHNTDSDRELTTTVEENIANDSYSTQVRNRSTSTQRTNQSSAQDSISRQNSASIGSAQDSFQDSLQRATIDDRNSLANETTFTCDNIGGVPTTIASTSRGDIPLLNWDSSYFTSTAYDPQQRCEIAASRLRKGYQNGLKYLTTGMQNGLNVICMTSTDGGSCEEVLLTLKPEDDPQQTLQALFDTRTGSSSQPLSQSSSNARQFIDLEKYLETASTTVAPDSNQPMF